jgi:DegV family protein with EDD domain
VIKILTDSTADLPPELVEQHRIHIIPQSVTIDGRTYLDDGIELGRREFYHKLRASRALPTTSQPSIGDFQKVFGELTADGSEVLCLTISSQMSGTCQAARSAAENMPEARITVMDTQHVSIALGQLAIRAAQEATAGHSVEEIVHTIGQMGDSSGIVFLVGSLEYLHKGGRIGAASAVVGTLLSVKPILTVKGGLIRPLNQVRSKRSAQERMLSLLEEQVPAGATIQGAIAHGDNPVDADWLAKQLQARYDCRNLYIAEMGPVVGTHVGPDIFGTAIFPIARAGT